jgi:hypothetical protein
LYAGLPVSSHDTGRLNTATFDNVAVTAIAGGGGGGGSALPAPWQTQDVGAVGQTGTAAYAAGTGAFTVAGAGTDIWGSSDAFRFVYQSLTGDGQIVARLTAIQNTQSFAKAGVMLRESLGAGSAHVILDVAPGGTVEFMTRPTTGGSTSWLAGTSQPPPAWLRLVRSGSTIIGYVSANGTAWTAIGSTTFSGSGTIYAGLIVTSHDSAALNTSTFDQVVVN